MGLTLFRQQLLEAGKGLSNLVTCIHIDGLQLFATFGCLLLKSLDDFKLGVEQMPDLLHEYDCALDGVVVDELQLLSALDGHKHVEDRQYDRLLQEPASEELAHELDVAEESHGELVSILLVLAIEELLGLFGEELVEAGLTVLEEQLPELTVLDVLDGRLHILEVQLEFDDLLAQFTIENAVLLLVLRLSEDGLHDDLETLVAYIFVSQLAQRRIVALLVWEFVVTKHKNSQFFELLIEVVGSDYVDNESNFLLGVFFTLGLFQNQLRLLKELFLKLVSFSTFKLVLLGLRLAVPWLIGPADSFLEGVTSLAAILVVMTPSATAPLIITLVSSGLYVTSFMEALGGKCDHLGLAAYLALPIKGIIWLHFLADVRRLKIHQCISSGLSVIFRCFNPLKKFLKVSDFFFGNLSIHQFFG